MAVEPDLLAGTITLTNGSVDFTGTGTSFQLSGVRRGDEFLQIEGQTQWQAMVDTITSNTAGTLVRPWGGATGTYEYRLRYQPDGSRVTAQARNLIELLGNGRLLAIAGAPEPAGVIEILPGGAAQLVPKTSLVSGANYDVQVPNPAARAPYDAQIEGFSVLISNMGDGRAAITSRVTATAGVWSDPAYVTGPVGPTVTFTGGPTTTLPPGSDATTDVVPVPGGYRLDLGIPEGEGFNNAGVYNAANAYNQDDVVRHNRSSFIALQAVPPGQSPSNVYPPVDTAYWQVLVMAGQDGTGTGDVVGPASSPAGGFARFSGTTGKLLTATPAQISDADILDSPTSTIKGRTAAGSGPATNLTAAQVLTLLKTAGAYARDNILGTVSQAGGVPTGAIIEVGSNASGSYVRFADGTQICYTAQLVFLDTNLFQGVTLPAAFAANSFPKTNISFALSASSGTDAAWRQGVKSLMAYTTTSGANYLIDSGTFSASGIVYGLHIGRWF